MVLKVTLINWRHTIFTADKEGNYFALASPTEQIFCWITNCPYSEHFCWEVEDRMPTSYTWKTEALRAIYWSKIWFLRAQPPAEKCTELALNSGLVWLCTQAPYATEKPWGILPDFQMPLQEYKKTCYVLVDLWCGVSDFTRCLCTNNWTEPLVFTNNVVWITLAPRVRSK